MKFIITLFFLFTLLSCNEGISFPKDTKAGAAGSVSTAGTTLKMVGFDQNILIHGDGINTSFISSQFQAMSEYLLIDEDHSLRTLPIVASYNYDEEVVRVYNVETGKSVLLAENVWGAEDFAEFGQYLFFVVERLDPITSIRSYELYKTDGTLAGTNSLILPAKPEERPILQGKMAYYPVGNLSMDLHRVNLESLTFSIVKTNQNWDEYHVISDTRADRKMIAVGTSLIDLLTGSEYTIGSSLMDIRDVRFENSAWKMVAVNNLEREMRITISSGNVNEVEMTGATVPVDYSYFLKFIRGGYCYYDVFEYIYCTDDSIQENFRVWGSSAEIFEILGTQYICSSFECHVRVVGLSSHFTVSWNIVSPGVLHPQLVPRGGRGYVIDGFDGTDFQSDHQVLEFTKGADHSFLETTSPIRAINKYFRTQNGKRLYLVRQLGIAV